MAGGRIEGAGLRGVMRLTRVEDHLAHVLDHCETDEPVGAWTGLACQDHGLALGGDVDNATLRRLSAHGEIADLTWEPRGELAAEHGQLLQAAIQAAQDGKPQTGEQLGGKSGRSGRWPGQQTTRRSSSCRTRASAGSRRSSPSAGWSPPSSITAARMAFRIPTYTTSSSPP